MHMKLDKRNILGSAAALFTCAVASVCSAQPKSPAGIWDCVVSGAHNQKGVAYIEFSTNNPVVNEFAIIAITAPTRHARQSGGRGDGGSDRNPGGSGSGTGITNGFLFGSTITIGSWSFNQNGDVVGFYADPVGESGTNMVSFTAKVVPGKRLTLLANNSWGTVGKLTFRGVPLKTVTNISGQWFGDLKVDKMTTFELFTLEDLGAGINDYLVTGSGPGYTTEGICLLSSQKKIAINVTETSALGEIVRTTVGSFNPRRLTGSMKGAREESTNVTYKVSFVGPIAP